LMDGVYDDPETVLPDETIRTLDAYHRCLINSEKVMIAAVNGPGIGYGTSSIALFDLVYAVPEAYFSTPFVKWGLCAEACSSFTLASVMGRQKASGLILADERVGAAEMERAGLITRIIHAADTKGFQKEVMKIAERIAELPRESLRFNKALMVAPFREHLLRANEVELAGLRKLARSHEAKVAIKAFAEEQERKRTAKAKTRAKL